MRDVAVKAACSMPHGADCTQRISGQRATDLYDVKTFVAHDVGSVVFALSSCAMSRNSVRRPVLIAGRNRA